MNGTAAAAAVVDNHTNVVVRNTKQAAEKVGNDAEKRLSCKHVASNVWKCTE